MSAKDIRILDPKPMHKQQVSKAIGQKALAAAKQGSSIQMNNRVEAPASETKKPLTTQSSPKVLPVAPELHVLPGQVWADKKTKDRFNVISVSPHAIICTPSELFESGQMAEVVAFKPSAFELLFSPE